MKRKIYLLVWVILLSACSAAEMTPGITPEPVSPSPSEAVTSRSTHTASLPTNAHLPDPTRTATPTPEPSYCALLRERYHPQDGYRNYCDAKYGFALDYPNTYTIGDHTTFPDAPNIDSQSPLRMVRFFSQGLTNYLRVETYAMPAGSTLEKQVEKYWSYPAREVTDKPYDIRIGGQPAIAILNTWHQDYSEVNLFFQHGKYYSVVGVKAISEIGLETNWQMVSSIQVTGVQGHDNKIPDDLIEDSYRLINPMLVPQP